MADAVIAGPAAAVTFVTHHVPRVLNVARGSEDYPNRRESGARRYLDVLVSGRDLHGQGVSGGRR